MAKHKIALIPGDGIGKEVLPEGVRVLEAAARRFNFQLEFTDFDWSCDRFAKTGKMMPGSRVEIGRIGLGVVIREGAPAPKLATPDDLKAALVSAKSIAYTDPKLGGVSVVHLMKLADQFGIRDDDRMYTGLSLTHGSAQNMSLGGSLMSSRLP